MFRLIVVPLDGTRFAEHAVPAAIALAAAGGGRLLLAHVDVAPLPLDEPRAISLDAALTSEGYEAAIVDYMNDVVNRVSASASVVAEWTILTGDVPQAVERLAVDSGADLVAMASHDRSALGRLVAGSVAQRVVLESGLPVLLVRKSDEQLRMERDADPAAASDPISGPPAVFRHVLIPLDGAPLAEAVLQPASRLARATGARITLLSVANPAEGERGPPDVARRGYLEEVARPLRAARIVVDVAVLEGRDVAKAILRAVTDLSADVIAMATHGRGGPSRLLRGSIAARVLRGVLMPILLVRPGAAERPDRHAYEATPS